MTDCSHDASLPGRRITVRQSPHGRRLRLPNRDQAEVDQRKLTVYLLSVDHPEGRDKARFFAAIGFTPEQAELLEIGLRSIAQHQDVLRTVETRFGTKYVIDGLIEAPNGSLVRLRTVWHIDRSSERPRFITAYPA